MKYKMTKTTLKKSLNFIQLNYKIGLAGLTALNCNSTSKILNSNMAKMGGQQYNFDEIIKIFSNHRTAQSATDSYYAMLLRSTIKEAYEMIKTYCDHHKKLNEFKSQPFYKIAKIIRDTLSHSMIIDLDKDKDQHFPIVWDNITIKDRNEINNRKLEDIGFTHYHAFLLLSEFSDFAKTI